MLKVKDKLLLPISDYFEDRQYVASYDGGPCTLIFANGKEFSFSLWTPEWVEKPVLPKGSAKTTIWRWIFGIRISRRR